MAKETPKKSANEMSFFEHIEELRWHLLRAALSVLVVTVVVFLMKNFVFQHVILGPTSPDFITYNYYPGYTRAVSEPYQGFALAGLHCGVSIYLI